MPTFQQIYNSFNEAKTQGIVTPEESLATYARRAMNLTGDPSYQSVAEGGWLGNSLRSRSADLSNLVESGPVDEWTSSATGWLGDQFGINPDTSRSVGKSLPRMAVDMLPMTVGAAVTGGAAPIAGAIGLGATSLLSGANAYEQSGRPLDAAIGLAAPSVGGALSRAGSTAALNLAARSKVLQNMGFTGGTKWTGQALNAADDAILKGQGFTDGLIGQTTKSFTRLDRPMDKVLGYLGGEAAANVGFTGLDVIQQGTDAVFNRDYLFANLVSNIPFGVADLAGSMGNRQIGQATYQSPEAPSVYLSQGEQRAVEAAAAFKLFRDDPIKQQELRRKYGLDIADITMRSSDIRDALNAKKFGLPEEESKFAAEWNAFRDSVPEAQAMFPAIQRGGAFGSEWVGMKEVLGNKELPIDAQKIVDKFEAGKAVLDAKYNAAVGKMATPINLDESLPRVLMDLNLGEFLDTPIDQRDYAAALKSSFLSLDGVDLVRDIHRQQAGLEPLNKQLFQEYLDLYAGKPMNFTPDKRVELAVAASLARGAVPDMAKVRKAAKQARREGQKNPVEAGIKEMEADNAPMMEPVVQKGLSEQLGKLQAEFDSLSSKLTQAQTEGRQQDLTGLQEQQTVILDQMDQAHARQAAFDELRKVKPEVKAEVPVEAAIPQVEPTTIERLVASMPPAWTPEVRAVVEQFYRTGDDTLLRPLGNTTAAKAARRNLIEASPEYDARTKAESEAAIKKEARDKAIREKPSVKIDTGEDPLLTKILSDNKIEQEVIPLDGDFFRAEDWAKAVDQNGTEHLVPLPDGELQRVEAFARNIMSKVVQEGSPAWGMDLVDLAKLLNNPEVLYSGVGKMVSAKGDTQFARASAGSFDFGMAEVRNGAIQRPNGKPLAGDKQGMMTELAFRVNGGDLGAPLQKDEVAFYKQLVPEAFGKDSRGEDAVHLQKLWDGLGKVGEQVKVVTYGQDGNSSEAKRKLDKLTHDWFDTLPQKAQADVQGFINNVEFPDIQNKISQRLFVDFGVRPETVSEYATLSSQVAKEPRDTGPRATAYYNTISPFDTKKYPVVRVDVVLPNKLGENQEFVKQEQEAIQELQRRNYSPVRDQEGRIVKLKDNTAGQEVELNNLSVALNSVVESANEASILKSRNKDKEITLWHPDNLHENLPNTLGWAMVQIVPHPVTGEKVMFVGEQQSRWGQAKNKQLKVDQAERVRLEDEFGVIPGDEYREIPGHPLLPVQHSLILKSLIKEAQKQGVTKIVLSDSKSAMITEKLDGKENLKLGPFSEQNQALDKALEMDRKFFGNDPSKRGFAVGNVDGVYEIYLQSDALQVSTEQLKENGFRLDREAGFDVHYDTTLPSVMRKLTGSEGEKVDMGVHKNIDTSKNQYFNTKEDAEQAAAAFTGKVQFKGKNSQGQEIWEVKRSGSPTFRTSDPQNLKFSTEQEAAVRASALSAEWKAAKVGEAWVAQKAKDNITGLSFDISNPSPRVNTLFARNQGTIYGTASYKLKQILINSKAFQGLRASDRLGFIFAHEQSHISFAKALDGSYGPEALAHANRAQEWVSAADPQAKKAVEDVIRELHLDKELAKMDGVRDVLGNPDPNEWLANNMAMFAFGTMKARQPKVAFAMLPKPIREFFEWSVQGMQNMLKGAQMWMKLGGKDYKAAKNMQKLMDSIRRSFRQAEWDAAQAQEFLSIQPSDRMAGIADTQFAKSDDAGAQPFLDDPKSWLWHRGSQVVQSLHGLARMHEGLVEPAMAVFQKETDVANAVAENYKIIAGEVNSSDKVVMTNPSFKRVLGSEPLSKLHDAIQIHARVKNQRMIRVEDPLANPQKVIMDVEALSSELRGRLAQFNPEAQHALATFLAQTERANAFTQKKFSESAHVRATHILASIINMRASFDRAQFKLAPLIAEGVIKDLELNDLASAMQKLSGLSEADRVNTFEHARVLQGHLAKLDDYYAKHPNFISVRRYGKLKQRITKDGESPDVIDGDTQLELDAALAPKLEAGWVKKGSLIREKDKKLIDKYGIADELLKVMQSGEASYKSMIEKDLGFTPEQKENLLANHSTSDILIRELNGSELYRPTGSTKFSGDLTRFTWWDQFQQYMPAAISAASNHAMNAKVNFWMKNPELDGLQTAKDQFNALFEQSKTADPAWARNLNKVNALWHIAWNLPGHMAELFQPMVSGVAELAAKGNSIPGALKAMLKSEAQVLKVQRVRAKNVLRETKPIKIGDETFEGFSASWLEAHGKEGDNVEIARMFHNLSHRYQKAPLSEIQNELGAKQVRLQRMIEGKPETELIDIVKRPFHLWGKGMDIYSQFTMHNSVVTLLAAYRNARKHGEDPVKATRSAELFDLTANNSGGRLERSEMFGKLGAAGHVVFSLSSFLRGRFSQAAIYYRHGFDAESFKNKLTPAQIKDAKRAFQYSVLAQLGAAGLLGLPFVGAGIALMEDMLDEDIKGKMFNALDEFTGDPLLTRTLTHGMAATMTESLGLPADMHSRLSLSSFLGSNAYDGVSAKSLLGPSVAMFDSLWKLGGALAQGQPVGQALTVGGPGGVKRLAEALSEDFQRDNPDASLAASALGFRSSQQFKRKELAAIMDKQAMSARRDMDTSAQRIMESMSVNPAAAQRALLMEADRLVPEEMDPLQREAQRAQNVKDLVNKVSTMAADKVAPKDLRSEATGRTGASASRTAQSMGVQMPDPMELARALAQQQTRSSLGQPISQKPMKNALLRDLQWGQNPWEFR